MPFVHVIYSGDEEKKGKLAGLISKTVARALNKEEDYVMLKTECVPIGDPSFMLGGSSDTAALVAVRSIGGTCKDVAGPITEILVAIMGIPEDRVYITFENVKASEWALGFNTFG